MHKMKDMPYHMGLQCKLYLSNRNKYLVALNDGASRYVYNHLVPTTKKGRTKIMRKAVDAW